MFKDYKWILSRGAEAELSGTRPSMYEALCSAVGGGEGRRRHRGETERREGGQSA